MKTYNIYIDEAGRWPLAWPMYVGLLLPLKKLTSKEVSLFCDSKKLSEAQREHCFIQIQQLQQKKKLIAVSAFATVHEIDTYGVTNALHMAIVRGLRELGVFHHPECSNQHFHLFIDGNIDFGLGKAYPSLTITTIIDGDDLIKEISMASIIAKVSRDRVMCSLPKKYQKYGFSQHKGYGTLLHREKIAQFWPSDIHRKLFLKQYFPDHKVHKTLPSAF